ncbi:MAG: LLM class flavin-dependent oxidoreductase [Candidatus Dormibacteraeota bacterium]|nr:LLM class flavin-dependent oxidoreductase [Candidatus Dormibacteraeota bacterium]
MRLGLGLIGLKSATRKRMEDLGHDAVAAGFDAVWVSESRADRVGGGLAAAALLAQAVPIRVGAAIDAGLYHPLHLAEDIAIADLTSRGRIEVLLRFSIEAASRYKAPTQRGWLDEFIRVLAAALSGAHIQWNGEHLQVPARIETNQPTPQRLALNPRPAQPAVPVWIESSETWMENLARELGFGMATHFGPGATVPAATGRWPGMLLCPADVAADDLLVAAGDSAGYFVVAAETPEEVASAGRRLAGPLRMPEFPTWVNA